MALIECGEEYDDCKGSFLITSVDSFLAKIRDLQTRVSGRFYFRGDEHTLVPHVGKDWYYGNRGPIRLDRNQEWQFLHRFRRFTNPDVNSDTALWETLFLARHHELPTRLLDWSTNPLVALYFALGLRTSNQKPTTPPPDKPDKYVWAVTLHPVANRADIDVLARRSDPLRPQRIPLVRADGSRDRMLSDHDAIKIVFPIYNSARITAQRGVFTWQSDPRRSIESYALGRTTLPDQNLDVAKLYRWAVPTDLGRQTQLMSELPGVGINPGTISPDLDGISRGLLQSELLFSSRELDELECGG